MPVGIIPLVYETDDRRPPPTGGQG